MKDKKTMAVLVSVGIGTFMSSLDSSAVNLAMPLIKANFGVSLSMVEWIVTAYLLVISSLLLTFGRISDLYGQKKVYTTGFFIFTVSSFLCGISVNIGMLIGCRVLQALGAGMLFSTGPAIITNAVPPSSRGRALSITAISVSLGLCAGPVVGGTLSTLLGWQSIFFINIPVGILGVALAVKNLPKDEKTTSVPFDILGSVLVFVALLLILLPLNLSGDYAIPSALFIGSIAAGLALVFVFIAVELKREHPMLNVRLFQNRVFAASSGAALFMFMAQFIMSFLAPFYYQNLRGFSAMHSGLLYLPMPIATMCIAPISGSISDRFDTRYISSFGALLLAFGLFLLSFLGAASSLIYIVVSMLVCGIGFGLFQTPNNSAIMGNVPPQNRGTASGILATMRNVGMVLGIAVSGALFSFFESRGTALFTDQGQTGSLLQTDAFVYALQITYRAAAIVAIIAMVASVVKGNTKPKPSGAIGTKD
jgi:EmrB/QacA subfamily drug resistance transporter